jgi:hypothetical protein
VIADLLVVVAAVAIILLAYGAALLVVDSGLAQDIGSGFIVVWLVTATATAAGVSLAFTAYAERWNPGLIHKPRAETQCERSPTPGCGLPARGIEGHNWYLLSPPGSVNAQGEVTADTRAPITTWSRIIASSDRDCEIKRREQRERMAPLGDKWREVTEKSLCVPADLLAPVPSHRGTTA